MKILKLVTFATISSCFSALTFAQGTLEFRGELAPAPTAPIGTPPGYAWFTWNGSQFWGGARFDRQPTEIGRAWIEGGNSTLINETSSFSIDCAVESDQCVFTALFIFEPNQAQLEEAMRGEWSLNLTMADTPEAIVRGQLALVPEPTTSGLLALGIVLIAICKTARRDGQR